MIKRIIAGILVTTMCISMTACGGSSGQKPAAQDTAAQSGAQAGSSGGEASGTGSAGAEKSGSIKPVSYTHLDVYKRQERNVNTATAVYRKIIDHGGPDENKSTDSR